MQKIRMICYICIFTICNVLLSSCILDNSGVTETPPGEKLTYVDLPEGLYGGDIYSMLYEGTRFSNQFLRIGYTYEEEMPIDNVKFTVYYGIIEDLILNEIAEHRKDGYLLEDIDDFTLEIYFKMEYPLFTTLIREFNININESESFSMIKCTYDVLDVYQVFPYEYKVELCKFNYSEECTVDFVIPREIFKSYITGDQKGKKGKFSFYIELVQNGHRPVQNRVDRWAWLEFEVINEKIKIMPRKENYYSG